MLALALLFCILFREEFVPLERHALDSSSCRILSLQCSDGLPSFHDDLFVKINIDRQGGGRGGDGSFFLGDSENLERGA